MQAALHAFGPRIKRALLPLDPSSQRVIGAVADVVRDKWRSVVLGNHAPPMELPPTCVGYWPSPSSAKLACFIEEDDPAGKKKQLFVEVWERHCIKLSVNVTALHGGFIMGDQLGGVAWSAREDSLVYVADKLAPATPFAAEEDDLGEQLADVLEPSLVRLVLDTAQVAVIRRGSSPVVSRDDVLAYVRFPANQASKLGLVFCPTRPSEVRSVRLVDAADALGGIQGDTDALVSPAMAGFGGPASRSPRWSPDGTRLVFLCSHSTLHNAPVQLWVKRGDAPSRIVVDVVRHVGSAESFPSLFTDVLPVQPFVDTASLIVSSLWGVRKRVLGINLDSGAVQELVFTHKVTDQREKRAKSQSDAFAARSDLVLASASVLGVAANGHALLHVSTPTWPGLVGWFSVSPANALWLEGAVVPSVGNDSLDGEFTAHAKELADCPSLLLTPKQPTALVVMPHGGPHSANTTEFLAEVAFLARELGCSVLFVNYRGSLGQSAERVDSLPGNAGSQDVADVLAAIRQERGHAPTFLCGGSHGGFIAAHLSAQHAGEAWAGVVLRNPVVNIASMVAVTDIPDWCWVEALGAYDGAQMGHAPPAALERMYLQSPMAHVRQVRAPTLVHVGVADRRVPPSQALEWARALRLAGVEVVVRRYPKDNHSIDRPGSLAAQWTETVEFCRARLAA